MAKITTSDIHRNDSSSSAFSVCILTLLDWVRMHIAILKKSRKADEQAPGSIHALRKLCDGECDMWQIRSYLHRTEVQEWHDIFFAWLKRVNRWIPDELQPDFQQNAEDDFRVLLELAGNAPEESWRKKSLERSIKITFETEEALHKSRKLADEKHPVQLGSSLHEYLFTAIRDLQGLDTPQRTDNVVSSPRPLLSIDRDKSGVYCLMLDDFTPFQDQELEEQGVELTAYDLEESILRHADQAALSPQDFDCESSTFIFRSSSNETVQVVLKLLFDLLDNTGLRNKLLHREA